MTMLFDPSTSEHLKPWLIKTLEPICDADPSALADYVLALLKHNAPESDLRKELASQLDEFLEKEVPPFIDALFTSLRTKSYLPYSSPPPPPASSLPSDHGIPIPLDAIAASSSSSPSDRGKKRPSEYDDDLRPPKGPRTSQDGPFSRHGPHGPHGRGNGNWVQGRGGFGGVADGMGPRMNMNGRGPQGQYHPPDQRRGICRDYFNNGYCARGAFCKYSHGEDALVPGAFPMNPQQMQGNMFMPMFPPGMPFGMGHPAAYDPHEARIDIRPGVPSGPMGRPQRASMLPRANGDGHSMHPSTFGELPVIQDLTPPMPSDENALQPNGASGAADSTARPNGASVPPAPAPSGMDVDIQMAGPSSHPNRPHRGSANPRGRGGRPGFFSGDAQRFRPERRGDKTLVVEKIPEDKLSLDAVNAWFKRFGTVTNVAVDAASAKALVSFSTHEEAHSAWKAEDAVFGNRFVKVFWHRPMEGQGLVGQRALAASAPLVAGVPAKEQGPSASKPDTTSADPSSPVATAASPRKPPASSSSSSVSALAAKQQLLEQQIVEQKALMGKLNTASAEEKKEIFAQLRKLGQEMKVNSSQTVFTPAKKSAPSTSRPEDIEAKERERLDKELDLHSAVTDGEETTEALQEKLARLKAEAASLGIEASAESASAYGGAPYGGYRGRGRGRARGYFRGAARGGPPRASMKLDNRPKKLLVKDVGGDAAVQAVRDWYEASGQVDAVESVEGGDVVVTFRTRAAAEQGLAKGTNIPLAGQKQVSWYAGQPSVGAGGAAGAQIKTELADSGAGAAKQLKGGDEYGREQVMHSPREEEPAVSGWGGDEDEDGMGML
ncbi:hypothetical protein BC834DRAFT_859977 [Gloeopeniophorella convolvens]|nr:hypothetical protein BC834DRAFT_859977 [Gloeopeniophorella convolvens]